MRGIEKLLNQHLIVCLGTGGVGKTTTAAALGLAAALRNRKAAVLTVDPALRLKDALGVAELSAEPRTVMLSDGKASFDALALDTKRTFDALITRVAPSPELARRILSNRIYRQFSDELGGSTEYMAMAKLHELLHHERYSLLVVDTPPSAHARDLLSAPSRLTELLATSAVRLLGAPALLLGEKQGEVARLALQTLLRVLQRWTGMNLLRDLSDFAADFAHLSTGLRSRARELDHVLRSRSTSFVLVTTPEPDTIEATITFHHELAAGGFPIGGIIANRTHVFPPLPNDHALSYPPPLRKKLLRIYADFTARSARERHNLHRLRRETGSPILSSIQALAAAPTSIAGLERFAALLAGEAAGKHAGRPSTGSA